MVGGCLQEMIGASNMKCKRNGVEQVMGASFEGINKYKTLLCRRTRLQAACLPQNLMLT